MPYKSRVTGKFKGTTDEIIQWAAYKHGIDVDTSCARSRWSSRGGGCRPSATTATASGSTSSAGPSTAARRTPSDSTAFNADYYGAIIRAYFDGKMPWLNDVERGEDYKAGRP